MVSLGKCNGSANVDGELSTKIYVLSEKEINVKVLNMITRINQTKTLVKYISCNCKWKFGSKASNSN